MKITIAYTMDEEPRACTVLGILRGYIPDLTVHKSERHAPYLHIYMTTKKAGKPAGERESD